IIVQNVIPCLVLEMEVRTASEAQHERVPLVSKRRAVVTVTVCRILLDESACLRCDQVLLRCIIHRLRERIVRGELIAFRETLIQLSGERIVVRVARGLRKKDIVETRVHSRRRTNTVGVDRTPISESTNRINSVNTSVD